MHAPKSAMAYINEVGFAAVLVIALLVMVAAGRSTQDLPGQGLHRFMTKQHMLTIFGSDSDEEAAPSYHTAMPSEVMADGAHITFDLTEAADRRRSRRSVDEDDGHMHSDKTFFKVHGFGRDYHLSVTESEPMFGDHSRVEHLASNGTLAHSQPIVERSDCYYRGRVSGANDSVVALSTCRGMTGAVLSHLDAFFVHPLPDYLLNHTANTHGHTHLVYRRSTDDHMAAIQPPSCGVGETSDPSAYSRGRFDNLPYHSSRDEILAKFNPRHQSVLHQFGPLYFEMAIVVDSYMYEYYDRDTRFLNSFILTMTNLMQAIVAPESSGFDMKIHLTRIIYLTQQQAELPITHNSGVLLDSFCKFQNDLNPPLDSHTLHHDVAILFTGLALCSKDNRKGCGELGRAFIGSVCDSALSCGLVRAKGIQSGAVLAHEFGHIVGADHDFRVCPRLGGYVMEASASDVTNYWTFSDCSKAAFRGRLSTDQAQCLLDCPRSFHGLVANGEKLPGEIFDVKQQCNFRYPNLTQCPFNRENMCATLYCGHAGGRITRCWTDNAPALEGTRCGENKICYQRKCVDNSTVERQRPPKYVQCQALPRHKLPDSVRIAFSQKITQGLAVDGGWADWSTWSECSLTCGGGLSYRRRECINPPPTSGGKKCDGLGVDARPCSTPPCPETSAASKAVQGGEDLCAMLSTQQSGHLVPVASANRSASAACSLWCVNPSMPGAPPIDFNAMLPDGEACLTLAGGGRVQTGKCLDGVCVQAFGCDGALNSGLKKDVCNTCGGTDQCCRVTHVVSDPKARSRRGRHDITRIPRRADNIVVRMRSRSELFVLSLYYGRNDILNENDANIVTRARRLISSTVPSLLQYSRPDNAPGILTIRGRLTQEVTVAVFQKAGRGNSTSPGVDITYSMTNDELCTEKVYWRTFKTTCKGSCGQGSQTAYSACTRRTDALPVNSNACRRARLRGQIRNQTMACNLNKPCPKRHEWRFFRWSTCTKTCSGGTQTRQVRCYKVAAGRLPRVAVSDTSLCTRPRPASQRTCNQEECAPDEARWVNKKWSPCSATCGQGIQVRTVVCRLYVGEEPINVPPFVCLKAGVAKIPAWRKCSAKASCPSSRRRPAKCTDISPLCKVLKGGGGCSDAGMKNLCCTSCF